MNDTSEPGWAGTKYNSQPSWDSELSTKLFCQLIMKVCETSIGQKTNYTGTANYQPVIGTSIRSTYSICILFISLSSQQLKQGVGGQSFEIQDLSNTKYKDYPQTQTKDFQHL